MNQEVKQEARGVEALPAVQSLAKAYELSAAAFVYTFKTVAMPTPHTDAEFVSCCLVAKEHGLNPLTKEIYFMKTKSGQIQPIVSVDGWVRKCNEHPKFDGMEFSDVLSDKGELVAVTCTIHRSDRKHPTRVTEYLEDGLKVGGPVWKIVPRRMLRHRALTQAARYAFGFAGVMDRDEFDQWQAMRDITPAKPAPLEIPDDIPDNSGTQTAKIGTQQAELGRNEAEVNQDELADPDGFLAKLADDLALCSSVEELDEIKQHNADLIGRLPKSHKVKAQAMLKEAGGE